ncbi:MAG: hypothetical protein O2894_09095 [Planctomycetota bacterium]|nr:hypothetical protein [Planctomycetota bacterium]
MSAEHASPVPTDDVIVRTEPREAPLSWLAILALPLAFVCGYAAFQGRWVASVVPIAIAGIALLMMRVTRKRGRVVAIFAILISIGVGSCSYMFHSRGKALFSALPEGVLAALSTSSKTRAADVAAWAWPESLASDPELARGWMATFDALVAEHGAWAGRVEVGEHVPGFNAVLVAPPHAGALEGGGEPPPVGAGVWVLVPFARASLWLCVVLKDGVEDARESVIAHIEGGPNPVIGGLRWFRR